MTYLPMDPAVLEQMYEHPERFTHMPKDEYIRILIEDIRYYRGQLNAVGLLLDTPGAAPQEIVHGLRGYLKLAQMAKVPHCPECAP